MPRRRYRLGKRAEAAEGTRRRILDATLALHDEQGISRTSVRDVAGRAGVSPTTVLRHFARMDELIQACGALSDELWPMPASAILANATTTADAVCRLARALFDWWERLDRGWDALQVDRRTIPAVEAWLTEVDRKHRALVAEALGTDAETDAVRHALATALTSIGSWRSLRDAGMESDRAAIEVARLIVGAGPGARTTHGRLH